MKDTVKISKLFQTIPEYSYNFFKPKPMETEGYSVDSLKEKKAVAFTSGKIFPLNDGEAESPSQYYRLLTFQINFMYYTGIVPYKPVRHDNGTHWTLQKSSTLQQVLISICHVINQIFLKSHLEVLFVQGLICFPHLVAILSLHYNGCNDRN